MPNKLTHSFAISIIDFLVTPSNIRPSTGAVLSSSTKIKQTAQHFVFYKHNVVKYMYKKT